VAFVEQPPAPTGLDRNQRMIFGVIGVVSIAALLLRVADAPPVLVFVIAGIAVAGLAYVLGVATEEAGASTGPTLSALLNATFGNAAEAIIVILAVREGLVEVAKASIVGSVLGNLLLILGASLLASGLRHGRCRFDAGVVGVNATMLVMTVVALGLPTVLSLGNGVSDADERHVAYGVAVIMAALYVCYLLATLGGAGEEEAAHGQHAMWSTRTALILLTVSAIGTGVLSEVLVSVIEPTIERTGLGEVFVGLIIVPLVGNVAEHFAAVRIAWRGNLDFAMGIAFNSAVQVALAVTPIAVLAGFIFSNGLTLEVGGAELGLLLAAALMAGVLAANGVASWIEGAQLLAIYTIAGIVFWYL
jgi:Ca2+:H+ antiporter